MAMAAGLPIPVATPARGTAFGTAGKEIANLGAMRNAFDVLCRMCLNYRRVQTNSGGS
jgi:4-hydroxythreonine-4-phosphate dehydrogenase